MKFTQHIRKETDMSMHMPPLDFEYKKKTFPKKLKDLPDFLREDGKEFFKRLLYIYKLVWDTGPWILFVMLFLSLVNGILPLWGALISKNLINALIGVKSTGFSPITHYLILNFIYIFSLRIAFTVNSMLTSCFGEMVTNSIRKKIMKKADQIDLCSFDRPSFYETLENANREAGMRPLQILSATFQMLSAFISMISFILIMRQFSGWASVAVIVAAIPVAWVNYSFKSKDAAYMRHRSKDRRQMDYYSRLMVDKDLVKEIRLFQLGPEFIHNYDSVFQKYFSGLKKLILAEGFWTMGTTGLMNVINCLLFLWVAWEVYQGNLTVGDYTLFTGALNSIGNAVSTVIQTTATIYEGTLFINNMIAFMDEKTHIVSLENPARKVHHHSDHTIEFQHVYFRYPGLDHDVLKDINLTFHSGDSIVLVGLNGAGKTTLLKLLTRLYDPTSGTILLDGHDIRGYDVRDLYDMYGTIFQDFGEYAATVTQNIAYGQIDWAVKPENIKKAAEQANADPFIENLPKKYDQPLMRLFDIDGTELSVGQWQKLAVARAFYGDSDILILDEPTASLDAMAEKEIFSQFDKLRKGKLTIFVSHRLSSAVTASRIIVLSNGEIVEEGTHKELMSKNGYYQKLFSTQAERYIAAEKEKLQMEE